MATANQLISSAFSLALSNSADIPLEADEIADGILQLNHMMASWNLPLGYTVIFHASDSVSVPDYAIDAMINNLAVRLAPGFGQVVAPDLRENARQSKKDLMKIAIVIGRSSLPKTLPQGTGNHDDHGIFYPPDAAA